MENERIYDEDLDYEMEEKAPSLPSRRDHQVQRRTSKNRRRKRKSSSIEFPMVRIMLVLFFTIVTAMFTYPVWTAPLQ